MYKISDVLVHSRGNQQHEIVTVEIRTREGKTGLGYTVCDPLEASELAALIIRVVSQSLIGREAVAVGALWELLEEALRNVTERELAWRALSAADIALWDLKAKILNAPFLALVGQLHQEVSVCVDSGSIDLPILELQKNLAKLAGNGVKKFKMQMKPDHRENLHRVQAARRAIGAKSELFVDGGALFSRKQAVEILEFLVSSGVSRFEEPISVGDLDGLKLLRHESPSQIKIASGAMGYDLSVFTQMIEAQGVDILQADATRCGGITGFMKLAEICESYGVEISTHGAPLIHSILGAVVSNVLDVEFVPALAEMEKQIFSGFPEMRNGNFILNPAQNGLGIDLHTDALEIQVA